MIVPTELQKNFKQRIAIKEKISGAGFLCQVGVTADFNLLIGRERGCSAAELFSLRNVGERRSKEEPMKSFVLSAVTALVLSSAAVAQQPPPAPTPAPAPEQRANTAMTKHSGEWRASKFMGLDIYNQQNEKIGDVNEILFDQSGRVTGYVLGVGGFLGMGEHDVLVKPDQIKFVNEPARRTDSARPPATDARNAPADRRVERAADEKWYPDHGIMNATKDQLKALPEFKYSNYN